jgi:hypothetical protein
MKSVPQSVFIINYIFNIYSKKSATLSDYTKSCIDLILEINSDPKFNILDIFTKELESYQN